jgi:hypothetical protein
MFTPLVTVYRRKQAALVARCYRAWDAACDAEADASTEPAALRASAASQRALVLYQHVQHGNPEPERAVPRKARGLVALGAVGKVFRLVAARLVRLANLARARAVRALRVAARKALRAALPGVRRVVGRVVARVLAALPRTFPAPLALVPLLLVLAAMSDPRPTLHTKDTPTMLVDDVIAIARLQIKISRLEASLARQRYGLPSWRRVNTMLTMAQNCLDGICNR